MSNATGIETKILNNVMIQRNGIIRDEFGSVIGRLFNDSKFDDILCQTHTDSIESEKPTERNFMKEIAGVINSFSKENDSDTPDFILAEYLNNALDNFAKTTRKREKWYNPLRTERIKEI